MIKKIFLGVMILSLMALATISSSAIASDCTISTGKWTEERHSGCLKDPGWFDVGAGIIVVRNAGIARQNGVGNMVTVRAYPTGRWYAPLKSQTAASINIVASKLALANALDDKAKKSKQVAMAAANAGGETVDNTSTVGDLVKIADGLVKNAADTKAAASVVKVADDAKTAADKAAIDQAAVDAANTDIALSMQTALNDFGSNYAVTEFNGMTHWIKRVSFFLGRSVGGFDSKVVDGDINAFGIAFDIAPEFSVVWGRAYFNQPAQTGVANNSRSGTVFGVQINLNAFKTMRGLTGSL